MIIRKKSHTSKGSLSFMSVYIYTLPKAGTYFFAKLLSNLGLNDTGYHLSRFSYLDTKAHSLEQNTATPGVAKIRKFFVPVVRKMQGNDVFFGHFAVPRNLHVAPVHMKYICSYRNPEKTLVSEFIDFRFRRTDVNWISRENVADDSEAFETFLEHHGLGPHLSILKNIVVYHSTVNHPLVDPEERARVYFANFETVLKEPDMVRQIAEFLGISLQEGEAETILQKTLLAETKTKAVDLEIDRDLLWTDRAREIYAASDFPRVVTMAQEQGLRF